ncbi:hypothetical protein EV356DRAFT_191666 [Viridothelium virens]|uniref:Fungal N-terminal domain-containing protein n=1 Tax=Viridothelium virens TaxID=1048519 RepID=A0A6A6H789_VIRVR|nr:hypothetical protein EV356DRAFT_191666 [Viridothelium virens]
MDPASIVGIIGSVVGIADVVTRSIKRLSTLKTKYRDSPFLVSNLIGQLCTIQVALDQLSSWTHRDLLSDPRYAILAGHVDNSLSCFGPLMMSLQEHLDKLDTSGDDHMGLTKKISFLWTEKDLVDYVTLLNHQVNALTLLLQAIQWQCNFAIELNAGLKLL